MEAFIAILAKPLGAILFWLYGYIGNYGLSIVLFTILIRTIIFPLTAAQLKQSAKTSELQPKMKQLQEKYGHDKEQLNQKTMEFYQQEGVNPMKGCLPLLIQMPIILGLFSLLRNPLAYITDSSMLIVIHQAFLWIPDLSQPDKIILPILAAASTYFSTRITMKSNPMSASGGAANSSMKVMLYVFPLMILWWGRTFPAGLTIYWFIGTLYQCLQQQWIYRSIRKQREKKEAEQKWREEHPELFAEEDAARREAEEEAEAERQKKRIDNVTRVVLDEEEQEFWEDDEDFMVDQEDYRDFYTEEELRQREKAKAREAAKEKHKKKK